MRKLITVVVVLVLIALAVVAAGCWVVAGRGVSAREQPTWVETVVARRVRHLAVPRGARERPNPVKASPDVIEEGLEHFADHCAICHANDGSGDAEIGRNLYPKAPDLRAAATQSLSDGELFYIIEHGVRLTGMPAWGDGTPESERSSWHLVHFIRYLPKLTAEELERMKELNPKSPEEWREEQEAEEFLKGREAPARAEQDKAKKPAPAHHH